MLNVQSQRIATERLPLQIKLMPHQRAMVYEMLMIENRDAAYAMMSDKPGAGKTYAVLALIYFLNKVMFPAKKHVNMIVVPYNICTQWKHSMEKIYGPSGLMIKYKTLTEYSEMMSLYIDPSVLMEYDILLTTSLYFDNLAKTLASLRLRLRRVFFDEADTIKSLLMTFILLLPY
jgi:N12 class adenine-specific DNA methylase|uniref:Helicase ATP-binding domain-containing protein n=1 Tax=viral metagenome TaxID=1070528 RepID=A0A6C0BFH3_9ZZZZ